MFEHTRAPRLTQFTAECGVASATLGSLKEPRGHAAVSF